MSVSTTMDKVYVGQLQQRCMLAGKPELFWPYIIRWGATQVVGPVFKFLHQIVMERTGHSVAQGVRVRIEEHVLRDIPDGHLDGLSKGAALDSFMGQTNKLSNLLAKQSFENVVGFLIYSWYIIRMLWGLRNPRLRKLSVALLLLLVACAGLAVLLTVNKIRPTTRSLSNAFSKVAEDAEQDLGAVKELRMYGYTNQSIESFGISVSEAREEGVRLSNWKGAWNMNEGWRQAGQFLLIYYFVGRGVMDQSIPFEVYSPLFGLSVSFFGSTRGLIESWIEWEEGKEVIANINEKLSFVPRSISHSTERGAAEAAASGDLILDRVCLQHGATTILSKVSMTIKRGQVTAVVGPSGSGKSTLLEALVGFGNISDGAIRFGEGKVNAADYLDDDRRKAFAYVQQDATVLEGQSIETNIVMGSEPNQERVLECARRARVLEFAEKFDGVLKTEIAQDKQKKKEEAWKPSGGERQRIAIARALYKDAHILVLDEPSRALDAEGEKVLLEALQEEAKRGKIVLLATHSLRLEEGADVVWEIKDGKVIRRRG